MDLLDMCESQVVGRYARRIWPWCEGLWRIDLGRFPIMRYMGYAILFQNSISCVLSNDRITGKIVAPGLCFSSSTCHMVNMNSNIPFKPSAYLCTPPPLSSMHLMVYPFYLVSIRIVTFWHKAKVLYMFQITE